MKNNVSVEDAKVMLGGTKNLDSHEKNIVYLWCYPRELPEYGLPNRIQSYIRKVGLAWNPVNLDLGFVAHLIEAERTSVYGKFMRHLMYSFTVNPSLISPVLGDSIDQCPICGENVYETNAWDKLSELSQEDRELSKGLAFSSKKSSSCLCLRCLSHLNEAYNILEGNIKSNYLVNSWNLYKK